jgi:NADH:ubiquinone oxidoreductase subunit F (NADH-binding)
MGRDAEGKEKYVICNADEGEPGTFKDRVLLSRSPKDVLLGMIAAAYAIGSRHGIIYLRCDRRVPVDSSVPIAVNQALPSSMIRLAIANVSTLLTLVGMPK